MVEVARASCVGLLHQTGRVSPLGPAQSAPGVMNGTGGVGSFGPVLKTFLEGAGSLLLWGTKFVSLKRRK